MSANKRQKKEMTRSLSHEEYLVRRLYSLAARMCPLMRKPDSDEATSQLMTISFHSGKLLHLYMLSSVDLTHKAIVALSFVGLKSTLTR